MREGIIGRLVCRQVMQVLRGICARCQHESIIIRGESGRSCTLGFEMPVQTRMESISPRLANKTSVSSRSPMNTVRLGS